MLVQKYSVGIHDYEIKQKIHMYAFSKSRQ